MFKGEYRAIDLVYNGKAINSNQEPYAKDYIIGSDCTFWQVLDYLEKIKNNGAHGSLQITYFDSNGREWGSRDIFKYETHAHIRNMFSNIVKNGLVLKGHIYVYDSDETRCDFDIDIRRGDLDD